MRLRSAVWSDLPAVLDVQQAGAVTALAHIFRQDVYPFPRATVHGRWASELADPSVDVLVVEDDAGRIAGFAAIQDDQLLHFGTAVQTWGSGLAGAAHGELIKRLASSGMTSARLHVFEENHRARRFSEKMGWRPTGRVSRTSFPPHPVLAEYQFDL